LWELNRCGWYIQSGSRYQDIKWPTKYKMSRQPNKWFEHNIFHDEQAIYNIYFRYKWGENRENSWNLWQKNQFLLILKFDSEEQKRNAGGDMSFLICGPWPGGSFVRLSKFLPKIVVFLPNFGDKCQQTSKDKPEFWESAKIFSHSFVNLFLDEYRNRNFEVEYIFDADYQLLFFPWCALFDQPFLNCGKRWWWSSGKALTSNLHKNFIKVFPVFGLCPKSQGCKMFNITKKEKLIQRWCTTKSCRFFIQFVSVFPAVILNLFTFCNTAKAGS